MSMTDDDGSVGRVSDLRGRLSTLEAQHQNLQSSNRQLHEEVGGIKRSVDALARDLGNVARDMQHALSETMAQIRKDQLMDARQSKIPWIPIIMMTLAVIALGGTMGTLQAKFIDAQIVRLYARDDAFLTTLSDMRLRTAENTTSAAVSTAVDAAQDARIDRLSLELRGVEDTRYSMQDNERFYEQVLSPRLRDIEQDIQELRQRALRGE